MNSKSNTQAMETEKVPCLLAQLAIPAVGAQVINLLYNIVDRIYIGHISGVGAAALTGVGLFTPILLPCSLALEELRVRLFLWERKIIRQLKRFLEIVLQSSCLWPQL